MLRDHPRDASTEDKPDHRQTMRGIVGLLTLSHGCAASPPATRADALSQTKRAVHDLVRERELPAISYVQLTADHSVLELHAGVSDVVSRRQSSATTKFMAYSLTKTLTAIAVLQLVERGDLELDAPLSRYVRTHPYGGEITLRMLLAHTAGVPNPLPLEWFFVEGDAVDREAALRRVLADNPRLKSPPGAEYRYSNIGYWLLEKTIESASGLPYARYVSQRIVAPLGLFADAISFELPPVDVLATGHVRQLSLLNLALQLMAPSRYFLDARHGFTRVARVRSWGLGYGGAFASAGAFAAVLKDLLRDRSVLLRARSKALLFEQQRAADGSALGWVLGALDGARYFGKQGGGLGFQGNLRIYPELGLGSVYLANTTAVSTGPVDALADRLDGPMVRFLNR